MYLEREVQAEIGMSVAEFKRALMAGELDLDVDVFCVAGLLRIGQNEQNGHYADVGMTVSNLSRRSCVTNVEIRRNAR